MNSIVKAAPLGVIAAFAHDAQAQRQSDRPNIVIIIADDLGWANVGYHGSAIQTPNIDKLAKEGVELHRFYTTPVSSPTRAGLLTGRYPSRFGIRENVIPPWRDFGVDPSEETLPEMLEKAGYTNRALIGKWHLGHSRRIYHPLSNGYTHFYGQAALRDGAKSNLSPRSGDRKNGYNRATADDKFYASAPNAIFL